VATHTINTWSTALGAATSTADFSTSETLVVTVSGTTSSWTITNQNSVTCSPTTGVSGATTTISDSTAGSYSVQFSYSTGGQTPLTYFHTLSGTTSSADTEVDSLDFGSDVADAELDAVTYRYDQITGIDSAVTFAKSSGDAGFEWQVTSSTTQPTSGWGTSSVSVSNNQYVHLKMTASSSYSTARSATFTIGSPAKTDTISTTTKAAPNTVPTGWNDVTIGDKSGQDVDVSEVWYADFDGTHTTTSPGAGFAISGLGTSITVTTSGAGDAISKDGTNWTTTSLTMSNGETLYARITGSASYLTGRSQTITPGDGNAKAWTLTTKDNKPSAFDLGDTSNTQATGTYYSNTITVAGLDASTSVTASLSSDAGSGNFGYLKNGSTVANAANTTAANGDEFQVSHLTKTGNGTVTTTTLTLGSTSDSFTTTNAGNQAGWNVFATSSGYNEGDTVGIQINAPTTSGAGVNFWWSVSPTDVDASTGSGTTIYYNGSKTGTPPSNIGGFNFTATEDYTDDGAAGTGAITYTVQVFSDSNRTTQVASTTVDINDTSQPLAPDTAISLIQGSQTKSYAAGSDNGHAITFNNGATHTTYAVILDGATIGSATEYGSAQGLGATTQTISIADDDIGPGNQTTFRVVARRTVANNGNNVQQDTSVTYTISRRAQTPSIDSSALVDANVEDDDVTWRWTVSGGDGGTVKYSLDGAAYAAVSGGQVDLATTRGSSHTFTVISDATVDSTTASADTGAIPYLPSDTTDASVTGWSNENYTAITTDFTVNIANIVSNISWRVLYGSTTPNTNAGVADANGDILVSGTEFPALGGSMNYQLQHRRATGVGGNNTWADFGSQFTKKRYTYAPAALAISHDSLANTYANVTLDITPPGTTTGIAKYQVSQFKEKTDAGVDVPTPSWSAPVDVAVGASPSYTTYNQARGDNETDYRVRAVGDNALNSAWVTVFNHNVGYLDAEAFTVTNNDSEDYAYNATTSFDVSFSNTDASHTYQVVYGTATSPTTDGGQRTGNGVITLNNAEYPAAGTDMYYQVRVARATSIGGSGLFVNSGNEFIKGRYPYPASALETFTDGGTEDTSGDFTVKVTPGTGANTTQITLESDYTNLQDNDTVVSSVVRAGDTIYARSTGANGLTTDTSFTTPATYLGPKAYTISTVSSDFAYSDTDFDFTFTDTDSDHTYGILYGTGASPSTVYGTELTGATSPQTINISGTAFPAAGNDMNYRARVKRGTASGGNGTTWTNNAVIITKGRDPGPPTALSVTDDDAAAASVTVTLSASGGDGASSYEYSADVDGDGAGGYTSFAATSTYTQARNVSTADYRARSVGANGLRSTIFTSSNYNPGFLTPLDWTLNAPTQDIAYFTSTPTINVGIADTDADTTYEVVYGTTTSYGTSAGTRTTDGDIALTGAEVPTPGDKLYYKGRAVRGTTTGGDGVTYYDNGTFILQTYTETPVARVVDNSGTVEDPECTVTVDARNAANNSGPNGATEYAFRRIEDGTAFGAYSAFSTTNSFAFATGNNRTTNQAYDYQVKVRGPNGLESESAIIDARTLSTQFLAPKSFNLSNVNNQFFNYGSTSFNVGFSGTDTDHTYQVLYGSSTPNTNAGTRTTDGNITISGAEFPAAGETMNYAIRVRRGLASGGSNAWVNEGTTFYAQQYPQTPTIAVTDDGQTSETQNVTITITAGDTDGGSPTYSKDGTNYQAGNTFSSIARGTGVTYYVKNTGANGLSRTTASDSYSPNYIDPASPTSEDVEISSTANAAPVSLSGGINTKEAYRITLNSLADNSTNTQVINGTKASQVPYAGNNLSITSDLPTQGNYTTFKVWSYRYQEYGGDQDYKSGDTFNVIRTSSTNTPPTISASASSYSPANNTQITLSATATDDSSVASIQWFQTYGTTITPSPSSNTNNGSISSTLTTPTSGSGTLKYYARATDDEGVTTDSNEITINYGPAPPFGFEVRNASGQLTTRVSSRMPRILYSGSVTKNIGTTAGTYYSDSVPGTGFTDSDVEIIMWSRVPINITTRVDIVSNTSFRFEIVLGNNTSSNQDVTCGYLVIRN